MASLHYERSGSGDPPLVFIPGWCCDHTLFQPQIEYFASSHHVVGLDPRGCGKSECPPDGYDIPTLAGDVAALCRELDLHEPVLIGHSLGGMIAIELAAQEPDLAAGVVADDPGPIDLLPAIRSEGEALISDLEGPDGNSARRAYFESMLTGDAERFRWIVDTVSAVPLGVAVAMLNGILAWRGVDALAACRQPVLVLLSQPSGVNDPSRLLAINPDVQIGITVGAGHFHQLEVPDQVNAMIERFLHVAITN